jgi:lysophospholipase L1-like esterase
MRGGLLNPFFQNGVDLYGNGYSSSQGVDPAYQAVLDYATSQGFTLPTAQQRRWENIRLIGLKSSGAWDETDALWNFGTNGSLGFASINWKNPGTFQITWPSTQPYYIRKQGVQGDGTATIYGRTGFIPTTHGVNFTLADFGIGIGILTNVDDSGDIDMGANDNSNADRTSVLGRTGANFAYFLATSTSRSVANGSNSIGRYLLKRISGVVGVFKNGASLDSASVAATGLPNVEFYVLAENNNGSHRNYSGRRISYLDLGSSMDTLESARDLVESTYQTNMATIDPDEQPLFWAGDSITFGTGTTKGLTYPTQTYGALDRPLRNTNIAVAGHTTAQALALFPTSYSAMTSSDVYVLFIGTNDVLASTATATSWANIQSLINNVKGLGVTKIVVGTLMDCSTYTGAQDTLRDDLNTLIKDNAASMGYVVADFGANVNLATHSATYYDDTVHPNNAGAAIMATIATAAIDTLI